MLDGTEPAKAADKCDASVLDRNLALGEKFGFTSTPSIIFADGTIVQGALPTEDLNVKLSAKRPKPGCRHLPKAAFGRPFSSVRTISMSFGL